LVRAHRRTRGAGESSVDEPERRSLTRRGHQYEIEENLDVEGEGKERRCLWVVGWAELDRTSEQELGVRRHRWALAEHELGNIELDGDEHRAEAGNVPHRLELLG
jgi:hypothetical protein